MKLDENLFDDIVPVEAPVVELEQPIAVEEEEMIPEAPEVGTDMAMTNLINSLIQDEIEAVDGYNSFIATFTEENAHPEMMEVVKHIASEEQKHIGELTELLKIVSPNAEEQEEGKLEAQQELGLVNEEPEAVVTIVEPVSETNIWEALDNIKDESFGWPMDLDDADPEDKDRYEQEEAQRIDDLQRLKYLYEKEDCCPLDKAEMIELQDLIQKYGRPGTDNEEDII